MAFKINNPFTSRYSNSNIPRGMQKMESNTPLFNHQAGHEIETRTSTSYTPGNIQHINSGSGRKCNPNSSNSKYWWKRRLDSLRNHFENEDGSINKSKGRDKFLEYVKFKNEYKNNNGYNKSTRLNNCKKTQLFEEWMRVEGKTDPEFAYNYMDSFYEKYKPKQHDEWKEINKGLLTTITEQRNITTTTNENQRPGYDKRWEEIKGPDGLFEGKTKEEWIEESIDYWKNNPPSSSTSTERKVGPWEIVSEKTEEK